MRLIPSLQTIKTETARTFLRFPVAIIVGFVISIIGITLVEIPQDLYQNFEMDYLFHTILSLIFSFPIFASLALIAERKRISPLSFILFNLAVLALTALYYFYILPNPAEAHSTGWSNTDVTRVVILTACSYLFATFAPFIHSKENLGFWQYNKHIIIGLFITFVYALVLYIGIALILFTLETLFDLNITSDIYLEFFIVVAGIFSPLLFFSKIPTNIDALNQDKTLPKIAKNFAQYILTPLISVYTIILYFYGAKVLITQVWPNGLISPMVIGYAVVGIINLIILHPYYDLPENKWIGTFRRLFYLLLIPLVFLLFAAVGIRIDQYGFTENRYYVVLLGLWLLGVAIYASFVKEKNLKFIPVTVSTLLVLSLFGPWSSFSVATASQTNRITDLFNKYNLIENGQIIKTIDTKLLDKKDLQEIAAILRYFEGNHDFSTIEPLLKDKLPKTFDTLTSWEKANAIFTSLGMENYQDYYYYNDLNRYYNFDSNLNNQSIKVNDFDNISFLENFYDYGSKKSTVTDLKINGTQYTSTFDGLILVIKQNNNEIARIDLTQKIDDLKNSSVEKTFPIDELFVDFENEKVKGRLYIQHLQVDSSQDKVQVDNLTGILLTKFK